MRPKEVELRRVLVILMLGAVVVSSCAAASPSHEPQSVVVEPVEATTSSTSTTTFASVTSQPPEPAVSTTQAPPVEMADPQRLISADLGVDVVVSTESRSTGVIDPAHGEVIWVPVGDRDPGPGEEGLVLMAAHLNVGEPFYDLVDDSAKDRKNGVDDRGLPVGAAFDFLLVDGTICRYLVIDPLGVDIDDVQTVPDQPAIYFPKTSDVMNPILAQLIAEVGQRSIVMMWVSYAGPNNDQWRPNGINRANNAVVFSELDNCYTPAR